MLKLGMILMCTALPIKQDPDRASDWTRDLDRDGIIDALDWDKDGDGTANLLDRNPENKNEGGEDLDRDGIPDVADWDESDPPRSQLMRGIQAEVYDLTHVVLMDSPTLRMTKEFAEEVGERLVWASRLGLTGEQLRVVVYTTDLNVGAGHLGWYDAHQRVLKIKSKAGQDPELDRHVFLHELAHAVAQANPELLKEFLRRARWRKEHTLLGTQWFYTDSRGEVFDFLESDALTAPDYVSINVRGPDFVSEYAKLGGDEMFAESVALVLSRAATIGRPAFLRTELGMWLEAELSTGH